MEIKKFTVREGEFSAFVVHYPNFVEQFREVPRLTSSGPALVFLQQGKGYFPAKVTQSSLGIYEVEQVPVYHGVGKWKTGDSFSDLEAILREGFLEQTHSENVIIASAPVVTPDPAWWAYASKSNLESTKGDQYCLEMYHHENVLRKDFPEPGLFTTTYMRWEKVFPENIVVCVKISSSLNAPNREKRLDFYRERMKRREYKLVD